MIGRLSVAFIRDIQDASASLAVHGVWIVPLKSTDGLGKADLIGSEENLGQTQEQRDPKDHNDDGD